MCQEPHPHYKANQRRRELFWSGTATAEGKYRGAKGRSVRAKRGKIFSPSFFSCLDGQSWHLRALHCTVTFFLLSVSSVTVDGVTWNGDNARFAIITCIPVAHAY